MKTAAAMTPRTALFSLLLVLPSAAFSQAVDPTPSGEGPRHECRTFLPRDKIGRSVAPTLAKFTVTAEGAVRDISIEDSSGNHDVDNAAIRCISRWRYKLALQDGTPVEKPWEARVNWLVRH